MKIMFRMMNEARLDVAIEGLAVSSSAYLHAASYAKSRVQGADPAKKGDSAPPVTIVKHPDVRRMLLWMKAHKDGFRALLYFCALCGDRIRAAADEAAGIDAHAYDTLSGDHVKGAPDLVSGGTEPVGARLVTSTISPPSSGV